jgi:hypothetical protein
MRRRIFLLAIVCTALALASTAVAQDTIKVRITNLSQQVISPPLVASHTWVARIFEPGRQASGELTLLAEDGDPSALASQLEADDQVMDVAIADGPPVQGAAVVLELDASGLFDRISPVGMLVTTNDTFFGLSNFRFLGTPTLVVHTALPAYDAGTEFNNELCAFIPGPPCGSPMVRDTTDAEGFVHVHPGIHGTGDLSSYSTDWSNPVVSISVTKN